MSLLQRVFLSNASYLTLSLFRSTGIPYFKRKKNSIGPEGEAKSAGPSRAHSRPASIAPSPRPQSNGHAEPESVVDALAAAKSKGKGKAAVGHGHEKDGGAHRGDFAVLQREALETYLLGVLHAVVSSSSLIITLFAI